MHQTDPIDEANKVGIIIGMDIINQGDMTISNFQGKTSLTFRTPSKGNIDFDASF